MLPQNWREQFQIQKRNEQRRHPWSRTIFLPITQEHRPNYRKAEASMRRESFSFSARELPLAVWAGSDGLLTVQGSSGHSSLLTSQSQKSAELPQPRCSPEWRGQPPHVCSGRATRAAGVWLVVLGLLPVPPARDSFPAARQGWLSGKRPSPAGTAWYSMREPKRLIF